MTDISNSTDSMQGKGLLQSSVCMTTWEEGVGSGWLWGRAAGCSPGIFCNIFPLVVSFTFDWLGPSNAGLIGNNWKKKLVLRRKTFNMGTSPKGAVSDSNPVKPFCQIQQIFTHGVLTVRCTFTALILLMGNQKSGSDQAKQQCFSCRSK